MKVNRRAFLKRILGLAGAAIVGPKVLYEAIKAPAKQEVLLKTTDFLKIWQDDGAQQLATNIDRDILKSALRSGRVGIFDRFTVYEKGLNVKYSNK